MEVKQLYPFALLVLLVAMIIGAGVLALDKFGNAAKVSTVVDNETVTMASNTGTTTNDDVTALTYVVNASNADVFINGNDTATTVINISTAGVITASIGGAESWNVTYTYDADSAATTSIFAGRTEVSNVSTNWLGLIVTIAILSIIIVLIVTGFGKQAR